jgi:multicomponent K+:H+ antiporter subunit G
MTQALDIVIAALIGFGAIASLLGSLGLLRWTAFNKRLHGPSVIATLGIGCVLLASAIYFCFVARKPGAQEILIVLFIFLTAPVSTQLLVSAVLKRSKGMQPPLPEKTSSES